MNGVALPPPIPAHHWEQIETSTQPYLNNINLALLGGSQAAGLATTTSDFDVMIIGDRITQPVSLIKTIEGRKYDLILRDPYTFAYDLEQDRHIGRGTLLHICRHGIPIIDRHHHAAQFQKCAQALHKAGPFGVSHDSLADRLDSLHQHIDDALTVRPTIRLVEAFMLAHDLGTTALRASRHWVGKGKILGRFLHEHMPRTQILIADGFSSFVDNNDPWSYKRIVQEQIFRHYDPGVMPQVPFSAPGHYIETPIDMAEAFTCVRTCPEVIPRYLKSQDPLKNDAAKLWLRWKFENAAAAITTDRIGRANNEYFYATAKYVGTVLNLHSYGWCGTDQLPPMNEKIAMCMDDHPNLARNIRRALAGKPTALLNWGQEIYQQTIPGASTGDWPPRLGLTSHRLEIPAF